MALKDVIVKIDKAVRIGKAGFGMPLILSAKADTETDYRVYRGIGAVGQEFAIDSDIYKTAELIFKQRNAPRDIAICETTEDAAAAITKLKGKAWRQLVVLSGTGDSTKVEIADLVDTLESKMYFCSVSDKTELSDLFGHERTCVFYHDTSSKYVQPVAALIGEAAGRVPGSFTYKNLILSGLDPVTSLTDREILDLHGTGAITLLEKADDIVTSEGIAASGEYLDIVDSIDWIVMNMEYDLQKVLNISDKVPYTDQGISQMENVVANVLHTANRNGIIADKDDGSADFTTDFPGRAETTAEDRENRAYNYGTFTFAVSGAIHTALVTGTLVQ